MGEYTEAIYKKYHDQVEIINDQIVSTGKIRLAEELVIEVLLAIDEVNKRPFNEFNDTIHVE